MTKEKIVRMNTWFICSNCEETFFISDGCYTIDNKSFFCHDCAYDLSEELTTEEQLSAMLVE